MPRGDSRLARMLGNIVGIPPSFVVTPSLQHITDVGQ